MLFYDNDFYLSRWIYKLDDTSKFYTYKGKYSKVDGYIRLNFEREEIQNVKGLNPIDYITKSVNKKIRANYQKKKDKIILKFRFQKENLTIRKHLKAPSPDYIIISGDYLKNENNYYANLHLSAPGKGERGSFGDYFSISETITGECGYGQYDTSWEIKGRYKIKNKRIYLYYSFNDSTSINFKRGNSIYIKEKIIIAKFDVKNEIVTIKIPLNGKLLVFKKSVKD
jgi:hypothetical protein